jgi:putative oxygen-independent coproporphyrinogen III oxidase
MLNTTNTMPLSLYIHIPWCVKKCPYCDFNSYAMQDALPEEAYIRVLDRDLKADLALVQNRSIHSIFFGGGTPSLFSAKSIETILDNVQRVTPFSPDIEITLEANPGTVEHQHFSDYKKAGINRISLGAQSFNATQLTQLGRIHSSNEISLAIERIIQADFNSYNIDIMYGLPNQSLEEALEDLQTALAFNPPHLSWYNLTIEPNTFFHHKPPMLPSEDRIIEMEIAGRALLARKNFKQYEISAFALEGNACRHNLNYWQFGDYLGIGAGAHGKITDLSTRAVTRYWKTRYPKSYLSTEGSLLGGSQTIPAVELPLEFMLNALRLTDGTTIENFETRTNLSIAVIEPILKNAISQGLLVIENQQIIPTLHGRQFLNNLLALF